MSLNQAFACHNLAGCIMGGAHEECAVCAPVPRQALLPLEGDEGKGRAGIAVGAL